jgi:riboflavin transporter FmnP
VRRGFLFGLGSFLVIAAIGSASSFLIRSFGPVGLVVGFGCIPLSIIVIRAAIFAPPHQSRLHAFIGWCLGFFVIDAAIFAAVAVAILIPVLLK